METCICQKSFFFNVGCHINGGILGQSLTQLILSCKKKFKKSFLWKLFWDKTTIQFLNLVTFEHDLICLAILNKRL